MINNAYAGEVMNVTVEILNDTSVRVSWERILNIPEITHYTVFYSRTGRQYQNISITRTNDSVVIGNLNGGARSYQFVVVAIATVNNTEILGERPTILFSPSSDGGNNELHRISVFNVSLLREFSCRTNNWWFGVSHCCCCCCCSSDLRYSVAEEVKCI